MPNVAQTPILSSATTQTYFLTVDNGITKRFNYNSFANTAVGYTGSSGTKTRTSITTATGILSYDAAQSLDVTGFKSYALMKVTTSAAAMVRIYTDSASRAADAQRLPNVTPMGKGLVSEVITTATTLSHVVAPAVVGFNNDTPTTSTMYMAVTNLTTGTARAVSVTLSLLQLET